VEQQNPQERSAASSFLRRALLGLELLDEFLSGFLVIGLPLIRNDLHLTYAQAGLLFTVGETASMLIEPALSLLSDRGSKRLYVIGGLLCMVAGFALAATAHSFGGMLVAIALIFPANGAAVGLAQAALIDQSPGEASRTMTRWTLMGAAGDLLSPLFVAAWTAAGLRWRPLFGLTAGMWLVPALCLWRLPFPRAPAAVGPEGEAGPGLKMILKEAAGNARLWRWIAVLVMTGMVDEVFLGFAALYLADDFRAPAPLVSLALGAQMTGSFVGLLLLDRLHDRINGERLLPGMAVVALAGVLLLLRTRSIGLAGTALLVIGLGTAGWYPIAKAAAYQTLPGRSGTVRALCGLTAPLEAALPALAGLIASRFGILAGVGLLGMAPVGVLIVASSPAARAREATGRHGPGSAAHRW
jgi:MFS family permease